MIKNNICILLIPFEDILHNNLLSIHNFTEGKTIFHKKQFYFIQINAIFSNMFP